jgi:hypothetical protein
MTKDVNVFLSKFLLYSLLFLVGLAALPLRDDRPGKYNGASKLIHVNKV